MCAFSNKSVAAFLAVFLTVASSLCAQELTDAPALDRAAVLQAAAEVTRESYPNADDVLVDDLIRVRYEADGTSLTTDETYFKVLTEKGKRENRTLSFHFTLPYEDVALDVLEVIRPDGAVIPVDIAGQSRVMIDRSQMDSNIYNPNNKVLQVGIPGLETDDLVRYRSIRHKVKARVPDTWSDYLVLEYTSPIKHFVYEVSAPKELPLCNIAVKNEIKGAVRYTRGEKNGRLFYRWEVSDVPRMYREPDMPPLHTVVQRLLVSTIPDWGNISKWYWRLCEPHLDATEEMKQTVSELTAGVTDRRKRIEAIFYFVSQKIRYMGITTEKEAPGYEPHDARVTFEQKYGVCRDKAALLVALLRVAGIEAYPVLIHNGSKKDADVPQPYFNHAVVAARDPAGSYLLMDPTDENTRELFPSYLCNQSYLVACPEGETLRTSPIIPAEQNMMRVETHGRVNANGDLAAETVLRFEGINDNAYRGYFSRIRPEQRREFFEGLARRVVAGARLTDFDLQPEDLRDSSTPLTARFQFEARDIPVGSDDTLMLPLPRIGARVGTVNFLIGEAGLEERKYPLVTKVACGVRETLTLDVGALVGESLAMPEYEPIEDEALTVKQSLAYDGKTLRRKSTLLLKVVEFSPAQYRGLKDTLKKTEFDARKMPIFTPAPSPSDVLVLHNKVTYDLLDAHTWTETHVLRKKILTYAGKKRHAELKLNYNPAWERLVLEHATVTAPDGHVKSVRAEERNLMDAAWVGSAPRYPPGKTLVISLPGVEVGSVIDYRVTRRREKRPFFAARRSFRGFNALQWMRVVVDAPSGLPLRVRAPSTDSIRVSQTRMNIPRVRTSWTATGCPAVKRERDLPPWWSFNPTLFVSTGDWKTYAESVRDALIAAAAGQPDAERRARALAAAGRDERSCVLAIRDFVVKQIRPAGPGLNRLPLSTITPADRTLHDGYGNTSDRAVVLYALLDAAGFRPRFVLASGSPVVKNLQHPLTFCPHPDDFGTVLVRVRVDGDAIYLNDTDQYAMLGATPHDGRYGLDLKSGRIITIRGLPEAANRSDISYALKLLPNGDARILRTEKFFGTAYGAFHRKFAEIAPEERRRYHQQAVARIAQSAEPDGELATRFDTYPGIEKFAVTVKRFAVRDGEFFYFALPRTLKGLLGLRAQVRKNPLYRPLPGRTTIRTIITPPEGFGRIVLKPSEMTWQAPNEAGEVRVEQKTFRTEHSATDDSIPPSAGRTSLVIKQSADLEPAVIPAADYDALLELERRLSHPRAGTILLTAGSNTPAP